MIWTFCSLCLSLSLWHPLQLSLSLIFSGAINEWFECPEWVVGRLRLGLLRKQKERIQETSR